MTSSRYLSILGACAILLLILAEIAREALRTSDHDIVVWVMIGAGVLYAAAVWVVGRHEAEFTVGTQQRALAILLLSAVAARCLLIVVPPVSTDVYRYVWDGRVAAAGINPYRHRPADGALSFLRDEAVYPSINRATTAVTIYPPAAQMIFLGVTRVANSVAGMKAAMVGFEGATVAALLWLLRMRGIAAARIVVYVWHPLPLFEFAGSGHIDAAAIALMMCACLAADRKHALAAGALLGSAALVKFFPAVIAPALYRRWGWRMPAAFLVVVIALYLPYLGAGRMVLGFLPGYIHEEGMTGDGYFVLRALGSVVPLGRFAALAYLAAGCSLLAAIAWAAAMRRAGEVSMGYALALLGGFTLLVSPHFAWYFSWIIPFLCFKRSWAWIYLSAAAPILYDMIWSPGPLPLQGALYVPFAVILVIEAWLDFVKPPPELSHDGKLRPRPAG